MAGRRSKTKRNRAIARAMGKYKSDKPFAEKVKKSSHSHKTEHRTSPTKFKFDGEITVTGTFSYSGKGFGFVIPDKEIYGSEIEDIFIPPRKTMGAMTGDTVTVTASPDSHGRLEGEVIHTDYSLGKIIGTLHVCGGYSYVTPDIKRYNIIAYVPDKDVENSGALDNWKVEIEPSGEPFFTRTKSITVRGPRDMPYFDTVGRISRVFGDSVSRDANYSAILYSHGIRCEFPDAVLAHAEEVSREKITADGRHDLRDKIIFTIDGAGAKDLDDAISLDMTPEGNFELGVHIADVSHYVRQNTPTEEEARLRGTSIYFTDKVIPMLPEYLSNDACSLNAGTDKYALSAIITLDRDGRRIGTRIFKSIIRSRVRGVYSEVNSIFTDGEASEFSQKYREILPVLDGMKELYGILRERSGERGVLELEDTEAVIILDEVGNPVDVVRRERGDAEKLIEQFMLQANMGVAEVLKSHGLPCLYRTHEKPDGDKIKSFAVFANNLGLNTRGIVKNESISDTDPTVLAEKLMMILDDAEKRGIGSMVSMMLLRSMMKAKYESVCRPHFGLGADIYCHFTSPIRRYPDLFVHTVITEVLSACGIDELTFRSDIPEGTASKLANAAGERGISSSEAEIVAQEAEREIEDLYMTLYMSGRIGEVFDVTVSSVIRSGLFVQCDNLIEGFVPASFYPNAKINEDFMTLTAGSRIFTLGTRLRVRLIEADVSTGKITFEPYEK